MVDLVTISFSSGSRAVGFDAKCMGFDPITRRYNGGIGDDLNLKCIAGLHEVGHFIRQRTCVIKMIKSQDES